MKKIKARKTRARAPGRIRIIPELEYAVVDGRGQYIHHPPEGDDDEDQHPADRAGRGADDGGERR